jgi:hypothetical protein
VLHANASTGSGLQGERNLWSVELVQKHGGAMDDKKKVRQQTGGARRVSAAVQVVMEYYASVSKECLKEKHCQSKRLSKFF